MAINPIQIAQRAPKKDTMDKLLQGLQLAEAAFKIPVSYQQYRAYEADAGMKQDEREGITTRAKLGQGGYLTVPAGQANLTPGGHYGAPLLPVKVREGGQVKEEMAVNVDKNNEFFKAERALRDDYEKNQTTKATTEMLRSGRAALDIIDSGRQKFGPDDIALVFKFIQTVEPGSFVREGEAQAAQRAAGLQSQLNALLDGFKTGQKFDATARERMATTIGELMKTQMGLQSKIDARFGAMAGEQGFKKENVVTSFWADADSVLARNKPKRSAGGGAALKPSKGGPKAGDVVDGHEFLGGDPGSENNWRKVTK